MSNSHYERWIVKTPVGILFIGGGIFFMYYSLTQLDWKDRWVMYGLISATAVVIGAYMLGGAFINKMKSDMIKRQKARNIPDDKDEKI